MRTLSLTETESYSMNDMHPKTMARITSEDPPREMRTQQTPTLFIQLGTFITFEGSGKSTCCTTLKWETADTLFNWVH